MQRRKDEVGPLQPSTRQVGAVETRAGEGGTAYDGMGELSAVELGFLEPGITQIDAKHARTREARLGQVGAACAGAFSGAPAVG